MPLYEHVFMTRQDVSTAQVETLTKEYSGVIEEGGGKIGKTEYWGLRSLAYKIKKSRKAHYTLLNIDAPPAAVAEMERRMGISTDVIRFITIKVEEHETELSVQMRKGDREDRPERGGDRGGDRGGFRGGERSGGGGFRGGERPGGGGGGYRGPREGGGGAGGGYRGPREGGGGAGGGPGAGAGGASDGASTFRPRPPRPPREGGFGGGNTGSEG
jgi:small subunit ribosomal protein S6